MTDSAIVHWASITKTLTAIAVMQLRDRGRLSLDDRVTKWVPELRLVHDPYGSMDDVTIRMLLSHSSGFQNPTWPYTHGRDWEPFEPTRWEQLVSMMPSRSCSSRPGRGSATAIPDSSISRGSSSTSPAIPTRPTSRKTSGRRWASPGATSGSRRPSRALAVEQLHARSRQLRRPGGDGVWPRLRPRHHHTQRRLERPPLRPGRLRELSHRRHGRRQRQGPALRRSALRRSLEEMWRQVVAVDTAEGLGSGVGLSFFLFSRRTAERRWQESLSGLFSGA